MKDIQMKYKADTGNSALIEIKSTWMMEEVDTCPMKEAKSVQDVIRLIEWCDCEWVIPLRTLPSEYNNGNDAKIYRPQYVEWLESQIK